MLKLNSLDILKNGATVISHKNTRVLAYRDNTVQPFIIWSIDSEGNCFSGNYFETLGEALTIFNS